MKNNNLTFKNKAELEVIACGKTHVIYSNEVEVNKIVIRIEKSQNKYCVFEGDTLEYTIKICNDSHVDLHNLVLYDNIPDGLQYEPNTFKVDHMPETPVQEPFTNNLSYKLNELKANSETVITFDTTVL